MSSNLTMTDLFCGAGGSSTGAVSVPGVNARLAANHWDRAIETHNANHPDTDHLQADRPTVDIDDVRFRMLEPGEIKRAMAFPGEYVMVGNRREQVKLSGNAVTPPAARDLIATVVEAITGEAVLS